MNILNEVVKQVQNQFSMDEDAATFEHYMNTLDDTRSNRQDLIEHLNVIYDQPTQPQIYNPRVLDDLDFYHTKSSTSIFAAINRTQTSFGEKHLKKLLSHHWTTRHSLKTANSVLKPF